MHSASPEQEPSEPSLRELRAEFPDAEVRSVSNGMKYAKHHGTVIAAHTSATELRDQMQHYFSGMRRASGTG
jgi:hypothetical protein